MDLQIIRNVVARYMTAGATYTKLKSGDWGLRVEGRASPGDRVEVRKKDGTRKYEVVDKVIWTGNGISLCTIEGQRSSPAHTSPSSHGGVGERGGRCAECQGPGASVLAPDSSGIQAYICRRCAQNTSRYERSYM